MTLFKSKSICFHVLTTSRMEQEWTHGQHPITIQHGQRDRKTDRAPRLKQALTRGITINTTSWLVFTARLRPEFRTTPVPNAPCSECPRASIAVRRCATGSIRISRRPSCCCRNAIAGIAIVEKFKIYLLHQFCSNQVEFFLQYTEDTDAKNDGQEFWNSNSVIFENFLKFSKRRRAVLLQPIWTIMVAAKLYQSRVLVTKFRQNRLTLKGRSASQRHTDRQTHRETADKLRWK